MAVQDLIFVLAEEIFAPGHRMFNVFGKLLEVLLRMNGVSIKVLADGLRREVQEGEALHRFIVIWITAEHPIANNHKCLILLLKSAVMRDNGLEILNFIVQRLVFSFGRGRAR